MILWEGESLYNREPLVAVLTGLTRKSRNAKIGAGMLQAWILPTSGHPKQRETRAAVCGSCPLQDAGCYVFPPAIYRVWSQWRSGAYPELDLDRLDEELDGRMVRLGAWGDPAMVPVSVWRRILREAAGWTGYTHQWRKSWAQPHKELCMASVESPGEAEEAQQLGWRTFRIRLAGLLEGEFQCPASDEGGHSSTCERCGLCNGTSGITGKSVAIMPHGPLRRGQGRLRFDG
jgi:hypothetical protein